MLARAPGMLGRIKSDPEHLKKLPQLVSYLDTTKLRAPPPGRYWSTGDGTPYGLHRIVPMYKNNVLGDCTCAALGHQDTLAAQWTDEPIALQDRDIVQLYKGSGYDENNPETDQGWTNVEAARAALKAGWIEAFAAFDVSNPMLMRIVINEFGFAYCGIDLPLSASDQSRAGQVWDVAPPGKFTDRYKRGSWGGHAAGVVDADHEGVTLTTWGGLQRATWPFVFSYFDEGIATQNRRWARAGRFSPSGIAYQDLRADIARLAAAKWAA